MIISVGDGPRIAGVLPELDSMLARPLIMLGRIRVHKRDGQHVAERRSCPSVTAPG